MAIQVSGNFLIGVKKFLDSRQSVKMLSDLRDINTAFIPDGFLVFCEEDGKHYRYVEEKYDWAVFDSDISKYLYETDEDGNIDYEKPIYVKEKDIEIIEEAMIQGWVENGAIIENDNALRTYIIDDDNISLDNKTYSSENIVNNFNAKFETFKTYAKQELDRLDNIIYIRINDLSEMDRTDVFYLLEDNNVLGTFQIYILDENGNVLPLGSSEMDISGFQPLRDARLETTSKAVVQAINEINKRHKTVEEKIGDVNNLIVPEQDSLYDSCLCIYEAAKKVGLLNELTTTKKTDLVSAVNELANEVGDLKDLKMDNKDNIVDAMNSFLSEIINVGTIIPFAGNVIPPGYLHCDGTVYKSSDYPFLAKLLNPGGDTFTVPNLKSRVCYGSIDDTTLLLTGGYDEVVLDTTHLPSHGHDVTSENGHYHYGTTGSADASYRYNNNSRIVLKDGSRYLYGTQSCSHSHTVEFSNTSHTHTCHYAGYGYGRGMASVTTDTGTINYANCLSQQNGGKGKPHQNWQRTTYMCYLIKY